MLVTFFYNAKYCIWSWVYLFTWVGCRESVTAGFWSWVVCGSHIEDLSIAHLPSVVVPLPAVRTEPRKRSKVSKTTSTKQKRARPIRGAGVVNLDSSMGMRSILLPKKSLKSRPTLTVEGRPYGESPEVTWLEMGWRCNSDV